MVYVAAALSPDPSVVAVPQAVYRGAEHTLTVTATDNAGAFDLSGASGAVFTLRQSIDDAEAAVTKTLGDGVTVAANVVSVALDVEDTAGLSPGVYVWDLWVTLDGRTWPLVPPTIIDVRRGVHVPEAS